MFTDNIGSEKIIALLNDDLSKKIRIDVENVVESTNDSVKNSARKGEKEGYLLIANHQTKGKGRLGRTFFSPEGTGIYMSLLLKPLCSPEEATLITTAAAVSVCDALEKIGVNGVTIKWVNDIFLYDKKVCGILTESGFTGDNRLDYVVLGVGINLYEPQNAFPDELKNIAGFVFKKDCNDVKNRFVAEFLTAFFEYYNNLSSRSYLRYYKERCNILGKDINVVSGGNYLPAKAIDVDENCNLIVQYEDGTVSALGSGEISVRAIGQLDQ